VQSYKLIFKKQIFREENSEIVVFSSVFFSFLDKNITYNRAGKNSVGISNISNESDKILKKDKTSMKSEKFCNFASEKEISNDRYDSWRHNRRTLGYASLAS
jgi:hypothetical protein